MKLNNYGWGMKEFIIAISAFAFCMIIVIILCNSLINSNKDLDISTELKGSSESSIKTYIGIEDKMVVSAKKYKIDETNDKIIISLKNLIQNGYINNVRDPKNNKECSGYVIYDGNKKEYKAYLSCAGNYQTSNYNKDFE